MMQSPLQVGTTLLAELMKLAVSLSLYLLLPEGRHTHHLLRRQDVIRFMTPALIYFVNNNLIFVILAYVNSTTYQAHRRVFFPCVTFSRLHFSLAY